MSEDPEILLRLVILDHDRQVLIENTGASLTLPEVIIPRFTRTGYAATTAAREKYGLELFVITGAAIKPQSNNTLDDWVLVCRLQNYGAVVPDRLQWRDSRRSQLEEPDRAALDAAIEEYELYDSGAKPSSFGRYNSLDELREWYAPHLARLGVREISIQQWNGDPWFALFRLNVEPVGCASQNTPKALWFKAVGHPNTREFAVTIALTQECPYWFPRIIATKPECNGWLMEGIDGHELDDEPDGRPWALTARILAKVQKRFVNKEDELLALGCRDWRMPRVLEALDPFFENMEERMLRQTSDRVPKLDHGELRELKSRCRDLCYRVEDLDIPYTIAHGDFSPHNVVVADGWPVLIDWAEAHLSFPFISWAYYWHRMIKEHPAHAIWHERMHRNYAYRVWAPLLGRRRVDEGMRLAPALAALILALYRIDDLEERQNRGSDRIKRSLVRLVRHELEILQPAAADTVGVS